MLKTLICTCLLALPNLAALADPAPVYVGSNQAQATIAPKMYQREGADGAVEYASEVVVAYADYRVALFHTFNNSRGGIQLGINMQAPIDPQKPIDYYLTGGTSKEDALDKAYGTTDGPPGYIYTLDAAKFVHEDGLAIQELASHDNFQGATPKLINRRQEVQRLVDSGQVTIHWKP